MPTITLSELCSLAVNHSACACALHLHASLPNSVISAPGTSRSSSHREVHLKLLIAKMSRNYSEQEEHKIKLHTLRSLPRHTTVVVRYESGHRRKLVPPVHKDGSVCN